MSVSPRRRAHFMKSVKIENKKVETVEARARQQKGTFCVTHFSPEKIEFFFFFEKEHGVEAKRPRAGHSTTTIIIITKQ